MSTTPSVRKRPYAVLTHIKVELLQRGISQVELAGRVRVHSKHLNAVLNGYEPLTTRLARDISRSTGIPLATILPNGQEAT